MAVKKNKKNAAPDLKSVLQEMLLIKDHLGEHTFKDLEKKSRKLREELERLEEYDLLLTLYNWIFDSAFTESKNDIDKKLLESFVSVTEKAGFKQEHSELIHSAHILISNAENGKADRFLLFEKYTQLAKLLIRHSDLQLKHQVLVTLLRICPFLENRNKYIDPYIDFIRHQLGEIIQYVPDDAHVLYYSLAVFSRRESVFTRMAYIDNAIELSSNHLLPDKEAYYRVVKAEIYCDDGDFAAAIRELDIVDHIIFTNHHFQNELKNVASTSKISRLLIYIYLEYQNVALENSDYKKLIKEIESNCSHWLDYPARINELQSLLLIRAGKKEKAAKLIKEAFLLREKNIHPQLSHINLLMHEILKEKPQEYWIYERIVELENSGELFYSSVWAGILKAIADFYFKRN